MRISIQTYLSKAKELTNTDKFFDYIEEDIDCYRGYFELCKKQSMPVYKAMCRFEDYLSGKLNKEYYV
jgi:hypothetical protein